MLNTIHKEGLIELFEKFDKAYPSVRSYTAGHLQDFVKELITSHTIKLLEGQIAEMQKMKLEIKGSSASYKDSSYDEDFGWGYNKAITDTISYLKEQIELIKQNI